MTNRRITHYNEKEQYYDVKKAYLADIDERGGDGEAWVNTYNAYQKLGELEDIEDKLGIDLVTLFKAYTDGFYVKGEEEKQYIDFENSLNAIAFKNKEMFYGHKWSFQYVKLYDYGKTWDLTEKELENEIH